MKRVEDEKIPTTLDVMGINPKLFEGAMGVLHDLTGHCRGKRYTIVIEVEPDSVIVRKIIPKA